jgi:MoaA/NifB/PqqE/SkfB family radical SAM enzyme
MPTAEVLSIVRDAYENIGFDKIVCLSHANEPMLDPRLSMLAREVKGIGRFKQVICFSNGEFLTKELAQQLDGAFDSIYFTLYYDLEERERQIRSMFNITDVVLVDPHHIATHFSPKFDIPALVAENIDNICREPQLRIIFNHKAELLFCCDEVASNFNFGNHYEHTIKELWFGEQYQRLTKTLLSHGGRRAIPYCSTCPRKGQ